MSSSSRCWSPYCQFATPDTRTYRNFFFARSSPPMWRNPTTRGSINAFNRRSSRAWAGPVLRIDRVELEDFGPFKGRQAIHLPEAPGVAVVYGENMRGKTVLLNAIRFALFGKVLGRARREGSLHTIGNWEQAAAGRYGFEVVLEFRDDGSQYRLTRSCRPRSGVVPEHDSDYDVEHFLQRDGEVLGPGQATAEIERIMPEKIARFFLFDGELLQEYEDLLRNESDMGRQISEAIEQILGVPVLTRSRATLAKLLDDYGKKEARSAQANTITSELGTQMNVLLDEREVLLEGLADLKTNIAQLRQEKADLDEQLRRNERLTAMMDKRDMLLAVISSLDEQIEARQADIAAEMRVAWKSLVATRASDLARGLRDAERRLQLQKMRHEVLRTATDRGADPDRCPTCFQTLSEDVLARMAAAAEEEAAKIEDVERQLRDIQRRLDALEDAARASGDTAVRMLWSDLNRLKRDRYTNQDQASELDRRLQEAGDDQGAVRQAQYEHEQTVKKIALTEEGLGEQEDALVENERNLAKIRARLESRGGTDVEGARQRRSMCSDLHGLFDQAVANYRDRLRRSVEADATELFLQLTTEPEYTGLRINESYGLTILHQDGSEIPVRSAGAEHVVALSLVGALQRNAPLQGPIFVDSPFGRLDTEHTKNVVSALPNMTEQVCLLVYEEELLPQLARDLLRGQLRAEYSLRRVSARHTKLEEVGGT